MASCHQWHLGMCQALTFHQLHKSVLLKETNDPSMMATALATGSVHACASQELAMAAAAELTQLQQLPPLSYKWTWGNALMATEVS